MRIDFNFTKKRRKNLAKRFIRENDLLVVIVVVIRVDDCNDVHHGADSYSGKGQKLKWRYLIHNWARGSISAFFS